MSVAPLDDVRRSAVLTTDLDDLAVPGRGVDLVALGDQAVAHLRVHDSTMRLFAVDDKCPSWVDPPTYADNLDLEVLMQWNNRGPV